VKLQILSVLSFVFIFSACGSGPDSPSGESNQSIGADATVVNEPAAAPTFQVDVENNRVYLESTGWISTEEFWDIYYNDPAKLPGDLDHEELAKLNMPAGTQVIQNQGTN
jgi:hypothetical protein